MLPEDDSIISRSLAMERGGQTNKHTAVLMINIRPRACHANANTMCESLLGAHSIASRFLGVVL